MSGWQRSCGRSDWHISHTYWTAHVMGDEAWECPGRMEHTEACDAWADTTARCTCGLDPEPTEHHPTERPTCARHAASHGPHASELPCYWCSVADAVMRVLTERTYPYSGDPS